MKMDDDLYYEKKPKTNLFYYSICHTDLYQQGSITLILVDYTGLLFIW